ncbi:hypothetical protein [Candidatus Stoquefichus sp. SB1]|jgi:hypothetical protein|uniref:hypothetical protein n=1 Tax=Candidatus Stoquefichus sp. SB1 TaxID=1658109 RepID=UPI00067F4A42|nr:hypothetical protein [Candidatus Stoquefichus sp. SB1]
MYAISDIKKMIQWYQLKIYINDLKERLEDLDEIKNLMNNYHVHCQNILFQYFYQNDMTFDGFIQYQNFNFKESEMNYLNLYISLELLKHQQYEFLM